MLMGCLSFSIWPWLPDSLDMGFKSPVTLNAGEVVIKKIEKKKMKNDDGEREARDMKLQRGKKKAAAEAVL